MKCSVCLKTRQKNAFVTGCTNFQRNALTRHESTADHKAASTTDRRQADMVQSVKKAHEKTSHVLFAQMGAALILATDDLPDTKFSSLLHA
ncbi:hypothetical protein ACOMHN_044519 [Nucella lapillus]